MLRAGTLNRRVRIEQRGENYDEAGQPIEGWTPVATVWADIRFTSGMEAIKAGAETSINKASVRIRYRRDLNAGMRLTHDGIAFNVLAVMPDLAKREYVDLACEVVNGN